MHAFAGGAANTAGRWPTVGGSNTWPKEFYSSSAPATCRIVLSQSATTRLHRPRRGRAATPPTLQETDSYAGTARRRSVTGDERRLRHFQYRPLSRVEHLARHPLHDIFQAEGRAGCRTKRRSTWRPLSFYIFLGPRRGVQNLAAEEELNRDGPDLDMVTVPGSHGRAAAPWVSTMSSRRRTAKVRSPPTPPALRRRTALPGELLAAHRASDQPACRPSPGGANGEDRVLSAAIPLGPGGVLISARARWRARRACGQSSPSSYSSGRRLPACSPPPSANCRSPRRRT